MERLVGRDLADLLRDEPKMDLREAGEMVRHVALGVAAAHRAGIVHRDLKPQNVFRAQSADGREATWKVLDFGLSKLADQTGTLTRGQIVGTPAYMAPEQASSKEVDARADVYALAAIAYRALTGQPPFHGSDMMALLLDVVARMPVRPRVLAPELSPDVERVLLVGLAKNPADRYATPGELASALDTALGGRIDAATSTKAAYLLAAQPWTAAPPSSRLA
jgi:serine/threonine-protein kinase